MASESDAPGPEWTAEFVTERLKKLSGALRVETAAVPGRLHQVAALLAHFDVTQLTASAGAEQEGAELEHIIRNSTVVYPEGQPRLMLRAAVRRAALETIGGVDAIRRTLKSIAERPKIPLQRMLDGYVLGRPKLLDVQNLDELAASLQVTQWFDGLLDTLPDQADLERRIEREALLKPFRDLLGNGFAGRADELATLRSYVGFLDAESTSEKLARGYRHFVTGYKPLALHAPGGMGKSTLLGRFILDHLEPTGINKALPFVYLDFDRPVLLPEQFSTLIDEAVRQLHITDPARQRARDAYRQWRGSQGAQIEDDRVISAFAEFVSASPDVADVPILFVLDTFEEVQYRGRVIADTVLERFGRLQRVVPQIRVVVAGRAPAAATPRVAVDNRVLGPLAPADAAEFLTRRGIDDPKLARRVADQVGGSPLSLRLALELIKKEGDALGAKGIRDLETRNAFFLRLTDSQIQGQLYRRILNHIANPDVQKLAHPGLVLRRVTPEIIKDVLSAPCEVPVPTIERARELFDELQREVSLVSVDTDGSLRHLPEVRTIMIDLLRADRPMQVQQIQERAVHYYGGDTTVVGRAELVYHLLMLQRDREEIDAAWMRGVEPHLQTALDDLPPESKSYLAARLDVEIQGGTDLRLRDREIQTARRIRSLLSVQRASEAAAALKELAPRSPGSVLYLPEAEVGLLTGSPRAAYEVAMRGLGEAALFAEPITILKLEVVRAWAERKMTPPPSEASVTELRRVFQRFAGEMLSMRFALHRLAVVREEWAREQMHSAIAAFFKDLPASSREQYTTLCWDVAGTVGRADHDVLFIVLQGAGLMPLDDLAAGTRLNDAVFLWDDEQQGRILGTARGRKGTAALGRAIAAARTVYPVPPAVINELAASYAEAADKWRTDQHLYEELEEGGRARQTA